MENPLNRILETPVNESRRKMFKTAARTSIAVELALFAPSLLAACTSNPDTVVPTKVESRIPPVLRYEGPINPFKELEYTSEASISRLTNALIVTGHPFLDKVAKGIKSLHGVNIRPDEFPDWVDERSFPFAIVQDNSNTFTTEFQISQYSEDINYIVPSSGVMESQEGIDKLLVGIKLGLKNTPILGDPLLPALLLAKGYLTLLQGIAFNEEIFDTVRNLYPDMRFVDASLSTEFTNRSQQQAVGRRFLYNNLENEGGDVWKIMDGFPILMLGPVLRDLVSTGKLRNYKTLSVVALAANVFTQSPPELQRDLKDFMESWRLKGGFTFPKGSAARILSAPISSTVIDLENQMIQRGIG